MLACVKFIHIGSSFCTMSSEKAGWYKILKVTAIYITMARLYIYIHAYIPTYILAKNMIINEKVKKYIKI